MYKNAHPGYLIPQPLATSRKVTATSANTLERLVSASATNTSANCTSVAGKKTPASDVKNSAVCCLCPGPARVGGGGDGIG